MQSQISSYCGLASRALCLSAPGIVVFAYWNPIFANPLVVKELLGLTLGLLSFLTWWVWRGGPKSALDLPNPFTRPLAYLCIWSLLTLAWPWAEAKQMAFHHWVCFAGYLLFLPPLFSFGASARFRQAYLSGVFLVLTCMLVLAAFQINGESLWGLLSVAGGSSRKRIGLTIGHNNGVSPILLFASFLSLGVGIGMRSLSLRIPFLLTTLACWLLILFFLLTRSTILGLGAGILVLLVMNLYPLLRSKSTSSPRLKKILVGGTLGLLLLATVAGSIAIRGGSIKGEYDPNLARNITDRLRTLNPQFLMVDSRARLWSIGATMMADHPLFGLGFSTAKYQYPHYQAKFFEKHPNFPAGPTPKHSERLHNDYLQWAVECGAIGLVLLLWGFFLFLKTGWVWMNRSRDRPTGLRFQQSCFFIGLLVVLMDAFFSFTAHIAPIAIFFPGLLVLWVGTFESPTFDPPSRKKFSVSNRASIAVIVWTVLAIPVGLGSTGPSGLMGQSGVFVPITAQFLGRTHEGELEAVGPDVRSEFDRMKRQFDAGTVKGPSDIEVFLDLIDVLQAKYKKVVDILPFAGQGILYGADFQMRAHVFLEENRQGISRTVTGFVEKSDPKDLANLKERLIKIYREFPDFLPTAERYYQMALESYRWHGVYWSLGLTQLELASRSETPEKVSERLVDSARESLRMGRRIFPNQDRFFLELDVALRVGDASQAVELATELMVRNPGLLVNEVFPRIAERSIKKDRITGKLRLDPVMEDFFEILLPHLTQDHLGILLYALTILDYGNSEDVAKKYATVAKTDLSPIESVFVDYRILKNRKDLEDLSEELSLYREFIASETSTSLDDRVIYLSDLQRFAPHTVDLSEWEVELRKLLETPDLPFPMVISSHSLAQEAYDRGDLVETLRRMVHADAEMTWQMQNGMDGRRNGTLDATLWGIGYPFLMN